MSFYVARRALGRRRVVVSGSGVLAPGGPRTGPTPARVEPLERRELLSTAAGTGAILRPDHIVVVIEQDRASDAIGNPVMPYLNALAASGLVYSDSHGVTHPSQPNLLALYSGSTQGVTTNAQGYSFPTAPNLARSLFDAGFSFGGYAENLPSDGSQVQWSPGDATGATHPDLYVRFLNPTAMFGNVGTDPATGQPRANAVVNRTFGAFSSLPKTDYSRLPTVSFVLPNNLHNTHGSNEAYPWAGSPDEENNDLLRGWADTWLKDNLDPYLQWAKTHNSLLIVTQDEERWTGGTAQTVTTVVHGDPDLFVPGTNPSRYNHYNLLRTIEDMYGLAPLGNSAAVGAFTTDAQGRLAPSAGTPTDPAATSTTLASSAATLVFGQGVTFTATVAASGNGAPTGTVTFRDGTTVLGTAALDAAGRAALTTGALAVGTHPVTAAYSGDAAPHAASTSATLNQTVQRANSWTAVRSSLNPAAPGQAVTFTATVNPVAPGAGVPTGTVQFRIDGINFGSPVTLVGGSATSPATSSMSAGNHAITAVYAGNTNFAASTAPALTQTIGSATTGGSNSFAGRVAISGTVATVTGSNVGATKEPGEPAHANNTGGKSVWWTWTAPAAGTVRLDTHGSSFDTLLAVYTGTAVNALTRVAANDDDPAGNTLASKLSFTATAGRVYQIAVDGYYGESGNITLALNRPTAPPAPTGVAASDGTFTDRVRVTWLSSSGAAGYEVWRGTSSSSSGAVRITTTDVNGTLFDDTTAVAGTTYWYWVRARNTAGTSPLSAANSGYRARG